jgi:hypothetical protein
MTGRWLAFRIVLDGGWIVLSAQRMDSGDPEESLLTAADGPSGWQTVCRLLAALERSGIKELRKPIELGDFGRDAWVIG